MSTSQNRQFQDRVRRLSRKHARMETAGVDPKLDKDGLIIARPRRRGLRLSPRPFILLILLAWGFKVLLYSYLGPEDYAARLSALDPDDPVARAGAFVLQADPATVWVQERIARLTG